MKNLLFKRVLATTIDYFLICIFFFAFPFMFGENNNGVFKLTGMPVFLPPIISFCYLVFMEYFFGATIGHQIFSLKVVCIDTPKIMLIQAFKRRLADIVDIHFSVGLIALFFLLNTKRQQRLGDLWAKTIVVDKNNDDYSEFLNKDV